MTPNEVFNLEVYESDSERECDSVDWSTRLAFPVLWTTIYHEMFYRLPIEEKVIVVVIIICSKEQ